MIRNIPALTFAAALSLSTHGGRQAAHANPDHSQHGFVLLGDKQLHLYHLARFRSPHRYQAFVRIQLNDASGSPVDIEKLRKAQTDGMLSLLSRDPAALPDLLQAGAEFRAELYAGYLRDREKRRLLAEDLVVKVVQVPYFQELQEETAGNAYSFVTICDKDTGQIFGAHRAQGVGSFEQLFSIGTVYYPGGYPETDEPSVGVGCPGQGAQLELSAGFTDQPLRLKPDDQLSGRYKPRYPGRGTPTLVFGLVNEIMTDAKAIHP